MKTFFKKDANENTVDRSTFFSAISYKFYNSQLLNGLGVEPKVCYRGVKGHNNLVDAVVNLTFARNTLNVMSMFHSTQNVSCGVGIKYKDLLAINGMYTTETASMRSYTNGNFEVNLQLNLF
ncbi:type IX secretion system membrane protein PorP/SprF [Rubrolithibacter danxiaensis]|uniref:type IX secretion system membrane protein PorP/SprF n=1 Tax=Rubrolithibacter danxiaensis TaxID=3390805 RepID=UPI003BF88401